MIDADEVIAALGLRAHPEGGWYAETWRDEPADGSRGAGSSITFLLREAERSHWHRVDGAETWYHHAGGPLELAIADDNGTRMIVLGTDLAAGQLPQVTVPAGVWQAARPLADAVLVGCAVAPAFTFEGFELAPPGWHP